jgi:hypothetical protein
MVELSFVCEYCGEVVATEADEDGSVSSDEFHGCIGETIGHVATITSDRIIVSDSYEIQIE